MLYEVITSCLSAAYALVGPMANLLLVILCAAMIRVGISYNFV